MVDPRDSLSVDLENVSFIPKPSTVFGENNLGEPLVAQRLVLDFAPVQELDNELVQRKCSAFWEYIKSRNDLHHILVLPDEELVTKSIENTIDTDSELTPPKFSKTAVSVLEQYEERGLINRIFEAKLQQSHCSMGPQEYSEAESNKAVPVKPKSESTQTLYTPNLGPLIKSATLCIACCCSKFCKLCRMVPKRPSGVPSTPKVQALCQKLQAWDTNHPKSMDPPGHAPALSHCIMQRKMIS
ncbi:hypothetical protein MSG28_007835 [Choristoneura fumiferana]|uniref:Uncharacterized protein n=1 Tax=Choristoneura fumiferana TaxID=7141 RepID=A0ACC0J8Z3_CHOFU|nr:hypothetical protein MSG28_007835 [Choristoneura fumiferana]